MAIERTIRVRDLHSEILGIDTIGQGKCKLDQWATQLPLAALSQEVLDYILANGGGAVANAVVYFGTNPNNIAGAGNSNVISQSVSSFKLRGFYVYGDGDATITLTFTPSGSTSKTLKWKLHQIERNGLWSFPNPIVIGDSTTVTLNITNDTAGAVDYYSMLTGEAV